MSLGNSDAAIFASDTLTFTGWTISLGLGATPGEDYLEAFNVNLSTTGDEDDNSDITLGTDIRSNGTITLTSTGVNGSIVPSGGSIKTSDDGAFNQLTISLSGTGTVGDPLNNVALPTEVAYLQVSTADGGVLVQNTTTALGGLLVDSSTVAGNIDITSDTGIEVRSLIVPTGKAGNITVKTDTGALIVAAAATIQTLEGNISLSTLDTSSLGFISIGHLANVVADSASAAGDIKIFRGSSAGATAGTQPAYVEKTTYHGAVVNWGDPTITNLTDFGPSFVCADGTTITFNAAGSASKIALDANYIVGQRVDLLPES